MFGKLMNNYYYGKSGKGDYRKEDLPQNRWQLFWEMLRIRFTALIRLNFIYSVAWLPTIFLIVVTFLGLTAMMNNLIDENTLVITTELKADFFEQLHSFVFSGLIFLIPCLAITGPFSAGVSLVTRNWARDEHAFIWSDFKDAFKENWKQALVISAITSVVPFIVYICWRFYGQMAKTQGLFYVIPQILVLILGLVWALAVQFFYPLMVTYKLKQKELLKNGILLAIGRFPQAFAIRLASALPLIIGFVIFFFFTSSPWVIFALILYYLLIGFSLNKFIGVSFANSLFDRFINVHIEGVEVNRGLAEDTDDYDEYEHYDNN